MARRNASSTPPPVLAPYVKTPLQLEQWAAYEALTAKHNAELKVKTDEAQAAAVVSYKASTLRVNADMWQQAENVRSFVAATMALVPADASQPVIDAATKWRSWALDIANDNDPALAQVKHFLSAKDKENPAG